jgi:SHS2 domain-containing protein
VQRYRQLEHTADIQVEIYGKDLAELLANAAFCVFDLMVDIARVEQSEQVPVSLRSTGEDELLMDWLRELLFLFSNKGFVAARAEIVSVAPKRLEAVLYGERYDLEKHGLKLELKTPTYHQFRLEKTDAGRRATVLFDA